MMNLTISGKQNIEFYLLMVGLGAAEAYKYKRIRLGPASAAFQFAPLGSTGPGAFCHDGINTGRNETILPVVGSGAFSDIQIGNRHPHQIGLHCGPCAARGGVSSAGGSSYI